MGDFNEWLVEQAKVLHSRRSELLDWDKLAEELEGMAASQRRELKNRLHVLLLHLLKWQTQPSERTYRGRGWLLSIREARRQIVDLMNYSPSLRRYLPELMAGAWEWACEDAREDAPNYSFPEVYPWRYETLVGRDFLPPD